MVAHAGALVGGPVRGAGGDLVDEGGDVLGARGQIAAPVGVVGEGGRDGGQPGQRPGGCVRATGRVQAPVEHGGNVEGVTKAAGLDRGAEHDGGVVAVDGEQGKVRAQGGVGGLLAQAEQPPLGSGVDAGEGLRAQVLFGGGGQSVVVAVGGGGQLHGRVGQVPLLAGGGGGCAVAGKDAGEDLDGV